MTVNGYLHPLYSNSLSEFGEQVKLPACNCWILKRSVPGTSEFDAMGCYPIFACENWPSLDKDLALIGSQLVSLSLVTDPFGNYRQEDLLRSFGIIKPYKEHFVVDLQQKPEEFVVAHHQRNARNALRKVNIEVCAHPINYLDEWVSLYNTLIVRHNIKGITKFSRDVFAKQLNVPGIVMFRAVSDDKTVGMLLWYVQGNVGYYHLGAYTPDGYKLNASFALFWTLLGYFAKAGLQWLSLGAGAGVQGDKSDGLTRFKRGWATGTRTVFFCGRIFDPKKYQNIISALNLEKTSYFPAYRANELV